MRNSWRSKSAHLSAFLVLVVSCLAGPAAAQSQLYPGYLPNGKLFADSDATRQNMNDSHGYGMVSLLSYAVAGGATVSTVGDGTTDARAAIVAADAANKPIVFPAGTYRVASDLTLTNQCLFSDGAKLKPDSNIVVTLSGYTAGLRQHCFDVSAGGLIVSDEPVSVCHFGADDGGSDDSTAFQYASYAQADVLVPSGNYVGARVTITDASRENYRLIGAGANVTQFKLRDDPGGQGETDYLLDLDDVKKIYLGGLEFHGNAANSFADGTGQYLVEYRFTDAGDVEGVEFVAENCVFNQHAGAVLADAKGLLYIRAQETGIGTRTQFEKVRLSNCKFLENGEQSSGFNMRGSAKDVVIEDCYFSNAGQYGLDARGTATYAGSSSYSLHMSTEVTWGNAIENVVVRNCRIEHSTGSFLQMVRTAKFDNCVYYQCAMNPYHDTTATVTFDAGTDLGTGLPAGHRRETLFTLTTTGTLPGGLAEDTVYAVKNTPVGNTFDVCTVGPAFNAAIDITDAGTGTHTMNIIGATYTTVAKTDDCQEGDYWPSVITYTGCKFIESSPNPGNRDVSHEESNVDTVGTVNIDNCYFTRQVNLSVGAWTGRHHKVRDTYFGFNRWAQPYNAVSGVGVDYRGCKFDTTAYFVVYDGSNINVSDCQMRQVQVTASGSSGGIGRVNITNSTYGREDGNSGLGSFAITAIPSAGPDVELTLRGLTLRSDDVGPTRFQVYPPPSCDMDKLFVHAIDSELYLNGYGDQDTVDFLLRQQNGLGDSRLSSDTPMNTLANSATPSIGTPARGGVWRTGGATAITNFNGKRGGESITVFVESGHTITNGATIVTRSGSDITGPRISRFAQLDDVWYEL